MHTHGSLLVRLSAVLVAAAAGEILSSPSGLQTNWNWGHLPVLLLCHNPDFPSTRFYKVQTTKQTGHAEGGACAHVQAA